MDEHLLGIGDTASWVLADFWLSLALAVVLLLIRAFRPRAGQGERGLLMRSRSQWTIRRSCSATTIPVLVWAFEANQFARVVEATHASVDSKMLLASMQVFLGSLCCLAFIVGFDLLGRFLEARRLDQPLVGLPTGVILVLGTVLADWLLSQIGWWALIHHHLGQQVASAGGF